MVTINNKTKKEVLSNCTIHRELSKHFPDVLSTICFEYLFDVRDLSLIEAIEMNDTHLLKYLVNKDIGVGEMCEREYIALMYVAGYGREECVSISANTKELGMKGRDGWTALTYAAWYGHDKCVNDTKMLLEYCMLTFLKFNDTCKDYDKRYRIQGVPLRNYIKQSCN